MPEDGIPVRRGRPPRKRVRNPALQRLAALYQDPDVTALLRHWIPERPVAGTITERVEAARSFLAESNTEIALAARHIEELTGRPASIRPTLLPQPWPE